jgi:hypothetical protein
MSDCPLAEEVKDFVLQLFDKDNVNEIEDWTTVTPTELGILSWHLDNFYCYPLWWIEDPKVELAEELLYRSDVL